MEEEPAGERGMVTRMVRFVSKTIKWSTPSKESWRENITCCCKSSVVNKPVRMKNDIRTTINIRSTSGG